MRHVVHDLSQAGTLVVWAILAVVWLGGSLTGGSACEEAPAREGRDFSSWIAGGGALLLLSTPASTWSAIYANAVAVQAVGLVVLAGAGTFTLWARLRLGGAWSSGAVASERMELRTDGPYAVTRHPIYTGVIAMLVGTALTQGLGRWVAIVVLITVAVSVKASVEERLLRRRFPQRYDAYRRAVPRLIPGLRAGAARRR